MPWAHSRSAEWDLAGCSTSFESEQPLLGLGSVVHFWPTVGFDGEGQDDCYLPDEAVDLPDRPRAIDPLRSFAFVASGRCTR